MQNGCTKGDPYSLYHDSGWQKGSHDGSTIITRKDGGAFEARRLLAHPTREKAATYKTVISHLTVELPEKALWYTNCPIVAMTVTETITNNARVVGVDPYMRYQAKKGATPKRSPATLARRTW